jgi:hypothetical protein
MHGLQPDMKSNAHEELERIDSTISCLTFVHWRARQIRKCSFLRRLECSRVCFLCQPGLRHLVPDVRIWICPSMNSTSRCRLGTTWSPAYGRIIIRDDERFVRGVMGRLTHPCQHAKFQPNLQWVTNGHL